MIATIEFKIYLTGVCIFGIVISKFSYYEEPSIIILLVVDKNP